MSPVLSPTLRRLAAFTTDPAGGNPAGVWIGPGLPDAGEMLRIAAEVGYSETAFLAPAPVDGPTGAAPADHRRWTTRYYSPQAEVSFCGHATIASGVVLGERFGEDTYTLVTTVGDVSVAVGRRDGRMVASLTSVDPRHRPPADTLLDEALGTFGWDRSVLDSAIPPAVAWAGAWHLVLPLGDRDTLDAMTYDFDRLRSIMLDAELTTVQVVWREREDHFHARDPFPVGGVVEDPATGAAAAALGGYLRDSGLVQAPVRFTILQGEAMGRPSHLEVSVPTRGGITVTGAAVSLEER